MTNEYKALMINKTWSLVPYSTRMNVVENKYVFQVKYKPDGTIQRYKARLVAKGFQQTHGLDYFETLSLVVKPSTIRVILTLVVTNGQDIQQIDINNTFLNGDSQEVVYMAQPIGFVDATKPSYVCRLHKALYELKQAPRDWFDKLKNALLDWGFQNFVSDTSLFIHQKGNTLIILLVYVDDILITSTNASQVNQVVKELNKTFALKTLGSLNYFLGFEVYQDFSGLYLTQTKYVTDLLKKIAMNGAYNISTFMLFGNKLSLSQGELFEDHSLYHSTIGA